MRISLTDFVDFVSKAGVPKMTQVRQLKERSKIGYHPNTDYYKYLRDGIRQFHDQNHPDKNIFFTDWLNNLGDQRKAAKYDALARDYKAFLGNKTIVTEENRQIVWSHGELDVSVNPELCLSINGEKHLIKLYFKSAEISKLRIDVALFLMQHALPVITNVQHYAILNIQTRRLLVESNPDPTLEAMLIAEAEYFIKIWNSLP